MPRVMSSNDVKQRWGAMIRAVDVDGDEVIVESHGKPKAVVVPVAAYEELVELREERRLAEAREAVRRVHERVAARNQGLTEQEAVEFAVQLGREINESVARGSSSLAVGVTDR